MMTKKFDTFFVSLSPINIHIVINPYFDRQEIDKTRLKEKEMKKKERGQSGYLSILLNKEAPH